MAVNCWVVPNEIVGAAGLIAIETSAAGATVSIAEEVTEPTLMPIVVFPGLVVVANPAVAASLLIVATFANDEVQCPVWVTSCVLPSV